MSRVFALFLAMVILAERFVFAEMIFKRLVLPFSPLDHISAISAVKLQMAHKISYRVFD